MPSPSRRLGCRAIALTLSALAAVVMGVAGIVNPPLAIALAAESSAVEWLQVVFLASTGILAARHGRRATRAGRPAVLEVVIALMVLMACVGETDIDRRIFGVKVIHTLFFVDPRYPPALRALAFLVIVGVPVITGLWMLARWKPLLDAGRAALREPWGQTAAVGAALYLVAQLLEGPIDGIPWQQHHMIEETSELIATVCLLVAMAAREVTLSAGRLPP
jgi:hypothetical protein